MRRPGAFVTASLNMRWLLAPAKSTKRSVGSEKPLIPRSTERQEFIRAFIHLRVPQLWRPGLDRSRLRERRQLLQSLKHPSYLMG